MARTVVASVLSPVAAVVSLLAGTATPACAQSGAPESLPAVTVTGRASPPAAVAGWGDAPVDRLPLSAGVFDAAQLRDAGARRMADLVGLDAGVADAYNAEGYWDIVAVRGFTLDNRFNFRRDGLPINAETSIGLENKERVELLKGASGLQAGTSAPGGLANLVVKRPLDVPVRSASLEWRERGSVTAALDVGDRFGEGRRFGLRLNAAGARLAPPLHDADGWRHLLALAVDARLSPDALVEAEFETSRRSQPSQPGFSLLGDSLPAPGDPRINLNNQPWSLPVVMAGDTASLRWQQRFARGWRFTAHAMTQRLRSDDRVAFPFGCSAADGTYYADRYCPDGTFDLYDFRSDGEHRRSDAFELSVQGRVVTGALAHDIGAGVLRSRVKNRFQRLAFNFAGQGKINGSVVTPAAPDLTDENTDRDERSTEWHLRDAISVGNDWTLWLGARHTRLDRAGVRTDGTATTRYAQSFTTPFAALSWSLAPGQTVYAGAGRGVESEVAPNRDRYTNAGEALPALTSRQVEIGWRGSAGSADWHVAAFDIRRPMAVDVGPCDVEASCTRAIDGSARHRGVEASVGARLGPLTLRGAAMWLQARRVDGADAAGNGLAPANVPSRSARLQAGWRAAEGLELQGALVHEGPRFVLPDNSVRIGGWTRTDLALRYNRGALTWRAGIDNLFDRRAWRESPYQFGHAYLYPLAPRTLRVGLQIDL